MLLCQRVRQVSLTQHPSLPGADLRDHIRQETKAVIRWKDGNPQQIAHRYQDEQMLHAAACLECETCHIVASHAIQHTFKNIKKTWFLLLFCHVMLPIKLMTQGCLP